MYHRLAFSSFIALAALTLIGPSMGCSSAPDEPDGPSVAEQPADDDSTEEATDEESVPDLHYTFAPDEVDDQPAISVELQFVAQDSERTELRIPDSWANVDNYADGIIDLRVIGDSAALVPQDSDDTDDDAMILEHEPGADITLSYSVVQTFDQLSPGTAFSPRITDDHFLFIGYGFFVLPDDDIHAPRAVTLDWSAYDDWPIANSHGVHDTHQSDDLSGHELRRAVYIGGDYDLRRVDLPGGPLHLAFRDTDDETAAQFADMISDIIDAQRQFFGDDQRDNDPILVTHYSLGDMPGGRGTAFFNGVGLWAGDSEQMHPRMIPFLAAHEAFHLWLGVEISAAQPHLAQAWLTEGFTNFYTGRFLLDTGIIDLPGLVEARNHALQQYALSPVREATNEEIAEGFWADRQNLGQLPYYRGEALAMHWDAEIRRATDGDASLDDFMRDLLDEARSEDTRVDLDVVARLIEPLHSEAPQELERFIEHGEFIDTNPHSLGPCTDITTLDAPIFDLGFDTQAAQSQGIISDVDPDGPAYEAGLRDDQTIVSINAQPPQGFDLHEATVVVLDDDEEREVTYLPSGGTREIELFALDEERYQEDPEHCYPYP